MNTFADKKTTQVKSAAPAAKAPTQASMSGFSTARSMGASTGGQGAPLQIRPMSPGTVPAQGKSSEEKKHIAQKRQDFAEYAELTDFERTGTRSAKKAEALREYKWTSPDYKQYQTFAETSLEKREKRRRHRAESSEDRAKRSLKKSEKVRINRAKNSEDRAENRKTRSRDRADKKSLKDWQKFSSKQRRVETAKAQLDFAEFMLFSDHHRTGTRRAKTVAGLRDYKEDFPGYAYYQTSEETRWEKSAEKREARRRARAAK